MLKNKLTQRLTHSHTFHFTRWCLLTAVRLLYICGLGVMDIMGCVWVCLCVSVFVVCVRMCVSVFGSGVTEVKGSSFHAPLFELVP